MRRFACCIALVALSTGAFLSSHARAASTAEAYALSAGGRSLLGAAGPPLSCSTFGPDPRTGYFQSVYEVSLPTDGAVCGVAEDSRLASTATGGVSVSSTLAVGFGSPGDIRTFSGASTGRAGFGDLGVFANAIYTGAVDGFTVIGAQAYGLQTETMTFGGAAGQGVYRPTFTLDGELFNVGRTDSQVVFLHSVGSGPVFTTFRIQNSRGDITYYTPAGYVASLPGMAVTGDLVTGLTVSGSTTFTFDIPIAFGVATDVTFGLWAGELPSSSEGLLTPSAGEVAFLTSVKLTGIEVLGPNGQPLDAFTIVAGSGTLYDRNGAHPIPEPGTLALMIAGLLGLALLRGSRRQARVARPAERV